MVWVVVCWFPAFAGMTELGYVRSLPCHSRERGNPINPSPERLRPLPAFAIITRHGMAPCHGCRR
ncbi:hypothetical protein PSEWESI4_02920 [Pseudomonas carbonaria]|uniref:Uncharacterized protein n=1 Tax=Zestomonas carbonaria TaxID=2762745 RepID=A0A7U7EPZ9_9GAMM|nr:hypothetical protein PSEWESI4_02920 [Pseudomonas carbonaria]